MHKKTSSAGQVEGAKGTHTASASTAVNDNNEAEETKSSKHAVISDFKQAFTFDTEIFSRT